MPARMGLAPEAGSYLNNLSDELLNVLLHVLHPLNASHLQLCTVFQKHDHVTCNVEKPFNLPCLKPVPQPCRT